VILKYRLDNARKKFNMRRLLLIRHAKSSHKDSDLDDHERPLNQRGERDRITMARHLADRDEQLDVIYTSTAIRAIDYAQTISDFTNITLVPDLSFYTFDADELVEILKCLPDTVYSAAIVTHNPAITRAVNRLTNDTIKKVPTSGIVAINCPVEEWADLTEVQSEVDYVSYPKMFY